MNSLARTEIGQMIRSQMRMTLEDRLASVWYWMTHDQREAFVSAFNKAQGRDGASLSYQRPKMSRAHGFARESPLTKTVTRIT